jgi:hypothetical protein
MPVFPHAVLFGFVFSLAYTPLQAVYPTEVLQYNTRAKGMALYELLSFSYTKLSVLTVNDQERLCGQLRRFCQRICWPDCSWAHPMEGESYLL